MSFLNIPKQVKVQLMTFAQKQDRSLTSHFEDVIKCTLKQPPLITTYFDLFYALSTKLNRNQCNEFNKLIQKLPIPAISTIQPFRQFFEMLEDRDYSLWKLTTTFLMKMLPSDNPNYILKYAKTTLRSNRVMFNKFQEMVNENIPSQPSNEVIKKFGEKGAFFFTHEEINKYIGQTVNYITSFDFDESTNGSVNDNRNTDVTIDNIELSIANDKSIEKHETTKPKMNTPSKTNNTKNTKSAKTLLEEIRNKLNKGYTLQCTSRNVDLINKLSTIYHIDFI